MPIVNFEKKQQSIDIIQNFIISIMASNLSYYTRLYTLNEYLDLPRPLLTILDNNLSITHLFGWSSNQVLTHDWTQYSWLSNNRMSSNYRVVIATRDTCPSLILTSLPLTNQVSLAGGLDISEVQFRWSQSPGWYRTGSWLMNGGPEGTTETNNKFLFL